jgi:predicted ester cyclase
MAALARTATGREAREPVRQRASGPVLVPEEAIMVDGDPKRVVRRLIEEVMNHGDLSLLDELYAPALAPAARRWVEPFLASFSDLHMRIVELVTENETVVGRFACSGTHTGTWLSHPATGRRFTDVAEVYFFRVVDGRIVRAWGLEDTADRLRQLGLALTPHVA